MGPSVSKTQDVQWVLETLMTEECPSAHPIWETFDLLQFANFEINSEERNILGCLKRSKHNNFIQLARTIIKSLSKDSESEIIKSFTPYQGIIRLMFLMVSMSGDPEDESIWLKKYESESCLIFQFINSLFRFLHLEDSPAQFVTNEELETKIAISQCLLFIQQAPFFGNPTIPWDSQSQNYSDPTPYLKIFNKIESNHFLTALFNLIPHILYQSYSNNDQIFLLRSLLSFTIPCIYSCSSWGVKLAEIGPEAIHIAFSNTFLNLQNEKVLFCTDQLVSLLYLIIIKVPLFIPFLELNGLTNGYIEVLLTLFASRYEQQAAITFFHLTILLSLACFTSSLPTLLALNDPYSNIFTARPAPHHGSYADLIIEILTNPLKANFEQCSPLIPAISVIIQNLSSTTFNLSFFSSNRLIFLTKKLFKYSLLKRPDLQPSFELVLTSIFQFIRFQPLKNISLLLYSVESSSFFSKIDGLTNKHSKEGSEPKDNLSKDNLSKDNLSKDNLSKDDLSKSDIPKDDATKDNISRVDDSNDNGSKENITKDDVPKNDIPNNVNSQEDINKEDISKDNESKIDLSKENMITDNVPNNDNSQNAIPKEDASINDGSKDDVPNEIITKEDNHKVDEFNDNGSKVDISKEKVCNNNVTKDDISKNEISKNDVPLDKMSNNSKSTDSPLNNENKKPQSPKKKMLIQNFIRWSKIAHNILIIVEASKDSLSIINEKEKLLSLQNVLVSILSNFPDPPQKQLVYGMTREIEVILYDWFRMMVWQLFPEECRLFRMHFLSFKMPLDEDDPIFTGDAPPPEFTPHKPIISETPPEPKVDQNDSVSIIQQSPSIPKDISIESNDVDSKKESQKIVIKHENMEINPINRSPVDRTFTWIDKEEEESDVDKKEHTKLEPVIEEIPINPLGDPDEFEKFLDL